MRSPFAALDGIRSPFGAAEEGAFRAFTWASEWVSTVGTNEGSGNGQQYRGLRVDGSGPVWAFGSSAGDVWVDADGVTVHTPVTPP